MSKQTDSANGIEPQKFDMKLEDVVLLVELLNSHDIEFYIDGGWGIDALLGEQTRTHEDLDIALPHSFVPKARKLLQNLGFTNATRDDTTEYNFIMRTKDGLQVDFHSYELDDFGKNILGVPYEARHLTGEGVIAGRKVRCIPPDVMIEFHLEPYPKREKDYHDVLALCSKYNIEVPEIYQKHI